MFPFFPSERFLQLNAKMPLHLGISSNQEQPWYIKRCLFPITIFLTDINQCVVSLTITLLCLVFVGNQVPRIIFRNLTLITTGIFVYLCLTPVLFLKEVDVSFSLFLLAHLALTRVHVQPSATDVSYVGPTKNLTPPPLCCKEK